VKRYNILIALSRDLVVELRADRREQNKIERKEERIAARKAEKARDALPDKARELIEDTIDFEPLEKQQSIIDGVPRRMMSLYTDDVGDIENLEAIGAVILGAWDTRTGEQVVKPHRRIGRFMPPRIEVAEDGTVTEVDDETPRPLLLIYGQAEPVYG